MIIAFSVTPMGTGESVGAGVAEAVRVIRASGLPNETNALFTTIDAVLVVAPRAGIVLKGDIRPGVTDAMTGKVESIERHLGGG